MEDFESLLKEREFSFIKDKEKIEKTNSKDRLKADKTANLYDLIKMIDRLVSLILKDVKFYPEESKTEFLNSMKDIKKPIITYKIINREIKEEIKPRLREVVNEKDKENGNRIGDIFGQRFKCLLQFNIFASKYQEAEKTMTDFEDLMLMYAGYFKKNGVAEIFFKKQIEDDYYVKLRETYSVRNIIYYVEIEKITVIFNNRIKKILSYLDKLEKEE